MELRHAFTVPTSLDETWALFMDIERVGNCFPGAKVTEATEEEFSGTAKVKLGPIVLLYSGSGRFVERDPSAYRAVLDAKGKDKRGNGTAGARITFQLYPDGAGTRADVTTDLAITGKPAQFGRGVMQDVSDKLLEQFSACIEQQLSPTTGAATDAGAEAGPQASVPVGDAEATGSTKPEAPGLSPHQPARTALKQAPHDEADDAVDLGAAVLPVLVRRYAALASTAAGGLILGWLLGRRMSS